MERDLKMTSFGPLVNVEHCRISTHWIWILNGYHSMPKMIRTMLSRLWPERTIASVMCYLCNLDLLSLTLLLYFIVNTRHPQKIQRSVQEGIAECKSCIVYLIHLSGKFVSSGLPRWQVTRAVATHLYGAWNQVILLAAVYIAPSPKFWYTERNCSVLWIALFLMSPTTYSLLFLRKLVPAKGTITSVRIDGGVGGVQPPQFLWSHHCDPPTSQVLAYSLCYWPPQFIFHNSNTDYHILNILKILLLK